MRIVVAALLAMAGPSPDPALVPLTLPSGMLLGVELMLDDEQRAQGLMFRDSLPEDRGLLFVFEEPGFHSFWMKNCKFPIDMLWLDADKRVVHLAEAVPPCKKDPCPSYGPMRKASYVIEMGAGQARREKAGIGSEIKFELPR